MAWRWCCERCAYSITCMQSVRAGGPFAMAKCEEPVEHPPMYLSGALTPGAVRVVKSLAVQPLPILELMQATGLSRTYLNRVLLDLLGLGYVQRTFRGGFGRYYVYEAVRELSA